MLDPDTLDLVGLMGRNMLQSIVLGPPEALLDIDTAYVSKSSDASDASAYDHGNNNE